MIYIITTSVYIIISILCIIFLLSFKLKRNFSLLANSIWLLAFGILMDAIGQILITYYIVNGGNFMFIYKVSIICEIPLIIAFVMLSLAYIRTKCKESEK